jgi:hypothetical protein
MFSKQLGLKGSLSLQTLLSGVRCFHGAWISKNLDIWQKEEDSPKWSCDDFGASANAFKAVWIQGLFESPITAFLQSVAWSLQEGDITRKLGVPQHKGRGMRLLMVDIKAWPYLWPVCVLPLDGVSFSIPIFCRCGIGVFA